MKPGFSLENAVREARERTGVPGVAAGLLRGGETELAADGVLTLGRPEPVRIDTPFRIASITKPFTATLCAASVDLDEQLRALLSHTAGLRCETPEPLPPGAEGLWSYSNAGYWQAGALCGPSLADALQERVLEPLALRSTGFEEPSAPARGHVQEGETGQRAVVVDSYPVARRASGGLWSTVADLLRFARYHLDGAPRELHVPVGDALGARYALGWWVRALADGRTALDHEGSVAGYQSLLLLVPEEQLALAVLTNSWRGSGLVRRVVESLGLAPAALPALPTSDEMIGSYALDGSEATVERTGDGFAITELEVDPVTGAPRKLRYPVAPIGGGVYAFARGVLMGHRHDFPRPGLARIGWVVLPRVST
jgi:CubicO group peptidase (beta-lactamase class C family)